MKPLRQFSDDGLLKVWSSSPTNEHVATLLATYGVSTTAHEVRRSVYRLLKSRQLLPARRVTNKDYARAKAQLMTQTEGDIR